MPEIDNHQHRHSLFWPLLLIGVGILLLLSNLGLIDRVNLFNLFRLWPLLLVAGGLQILFGRSNPWLSNAISISVVIAAIAIIAYVPSQGLLPTPGDELVTETYHVPLAGIESADVNIDTDYGDLEVQALHGGVNAFQARVIHMGRVDFKDSGYTYKNISLKLHQSDFFSLQSWFDPKGVSTQVEISPYIPVSLDINHGSGQAMLDVFDLSLNNLQVESGSSPLTIWLPEGTYSGNLEVGSGSLTIEMEPFADLDLSAVVGSGRIVLNLAKGVSGTVDLEGGSGGISINVPEGVGIRITGSTGSGSVSVPRGYINLRPYDEVGIWESPDFNMLDSQVFITFDLGSGNLRIND
jgi:hypothetical protein